MREERIIAAVDHAMKRNERYVFSYTTEDHVLYDHVAEGRVCENLRSRVTIVDMIRDRVNCRCDVTLRCDVDTVIVPALTEIFTVVVRQKGLSSRGGVTTSLFTTVARMIDEEGAKR